MVNVMDYGAKGDGTTDDTTAITKAMNAALSTTKSVYAPAGTYKVSLVTVPNGLTLQGAGSASSWLKGRLDFGSNQDISDLKIGPDSATDCAVHDLSGATNTVFEGCHFRGGGGEPGWVKSPVVSLGCNHSCSHITFRNCEVERNLGTEDSSMSNGYNDMSIDVNSGVAVSYITFDGCHVGVSNGAASGRTIGSPRMGLECWSDGSAGYPWSNITLTNCVFEAADSETADFSDDPACRCNGVLIEGCTFKGGGWAQRMWGNVLNFEYPTGVVVRNNTIYRGWENALGMTTRDNPGYTSGPAATFTGNTFDLVTDNGITPAGGDQVCLMGLNNVFTGNTITVATGHRGIQLDNCHYNTVTGNTIHCGGLVPVGEIDGSSNNTITPNTVN
jgi:Pectate lyase superfamily protein